MAKGRILVPTDFSKQADIAFKQSVFFSKKTDMEIFLLHVMPKIRTMNVSCADNNIEDIQHKFERLINEAKCFSETKIHSRIECGKVLSKILEVEGEVKPNFMFVGTDLSDSEASSVALRLIDNVSCPIIVFTGRFNNIGCKNIVLPVDLTKETKQKINLTIELAKIYEATVHVISVINSYNDEEFLKKKRQLEEVKCIFNNSGINCIPKLIKTKNDVEIMANAINDYADDINSDLIVIMTRQETKIQKFFIGSMATKLIRKANAPILCVSPKF